MPTYGDRTVQSNTAGLFLWNKKNNNPEKPQQCSLRISSIKLPTCAGINYRQGFKNRYLTPFFFFKEKKKKLFSVNLS